MCVCVCVCGGGGGVIFCTDVLLIYMVKIGNASSDLPLKLFDDFLCSV